MLFISFGTFCLVHFLHLPFVILAYYKSWSKCISFHNEEHRNVRFTFSGSSEYPNLPPTRPKRDMVYKKLKLDLIDLFVRPSRIRSIQSKMYIFIINQDMNLFNRLWLYKMTLLEINDISFFSLLLIKDFFLEN